MLELNQAQIILLRQAINFVNVEIHTNGKTYQIPANNLISIEDIGKNKDFTFTIQEPIKNIKIGSPLKLYTVGNGVRLLFYQGNISKLISISTDRTQITISPSQTSKAKLITSDKMQMVERPAGILCGAIYGFKDTTKPHLLCGAIPTTTSITVIDNYQDVSQFKIKENILMQPADNQELILWVSNNNQKYQVASISNNTVLLYDSVSINKVDKLEVYLTCDYSLHNCQSSSTFKGDAYCSRQVANGADYHTKTNLNNKTTNIYFDPLDEIDRAIIRFATNINEEELSESNSVSLDNTLASDIANKMMQLQEYGQVATSLAITALLTTYTGGAFTIIESALGNLSLVNTIMATISKLGKLGDVLGGLLGDIGSIISSLLGDDDVYERYGVFGFPNVNDNWFEHNFIPTMSSGVPRMRPFGQAIVLLQPKYKSFAEFRFLCNWDWEIAGAGGSIAGDLTDIDVEIDIDFNYGLTSTIYGGIPKTTEIKKIYSRYASIGDIDANGFLVPDLKNYANLSYSPIVEPSNVGSVQNAMSNKSLSIFLSMLERENIGGEHPERDSKDIVSTMLGTYEYGNHIIPVFENGKANQINAYSIGSWWQNAVDVPYVVLTDKNQDKSPVYLTNQKYNKIYNNDDVDVEVAYQVPAGMIALLYASVEAPAKQFNITSQKVGIRDVLASDNIKYTPFYCTIAINDLPPAISKDVINYDALKSSIFVGANLQTQATDEVDYLPIDTRIIL